MNFLDWVRDNSFPLFCSAFMSVLVGLLVASCYVQARVVNEKFGTEYTASEMFFAGETITEVIVGNKSRLDVDLMK